jgi:Kdo2-lipid IVA lauroyltransferase/acyltransferase
LKRLRHLLEYFAVRVVLVCVRLMPHRLVHALGSGIGLVFYALDMRHRRLAVQNLRAAFPLRSRRECRRIARATFAHFGRLLTTLLKFSTMTPAQMLERIEFEGIDHAQSAIAAQRGVLFYTGHFGFWELNALAHALALPPMAVLARPLDNPWLNALLERARTCTGNSVIYRKGAIRRVLRLLAANNGVAILIDQHIQSTDAVTVDFFNRPASTTSALAALALRTGARVIPVFALPLPGARYRLVYEHAVEPPHRTDDDASPEAIRDFTQRCTDVLEMYVRRYPELWLWMHRRWRDSDALPADPGMFPAAASEDPDSQLNVDEGQPQIDADERR